jgi:hypothetical protein
MALTDVRQTVLAVVNEVQRRLGLTPTSSTSSNGHATVLVGLLNDVLDDIADDGDWVEMEASANVTAVSGQAAYEIPQASAQQVVKSIDEIRISGRAPALDWFFDISEYRQLASLNTTGMPNRAVVDGIDANGNPTFAVWPRPGASQDGNLFFVYFRVKPPIYIAGTDDATQVPFPSRMVIQGLHAMAILDENGGSPTPDYQIELAKYERMKRQARNRFTSDTGDTVQFTPGR